MALELKAVRVRARGRESCSDSGSVSCLSGALVLVLEQDVYSQDDHLSPASSFFGLKNDMRQLEGVCLVWFFLFGFTIEWNCLLN